MHLMLPGLETWGTFLSFFILAVLFALTKNVMMASLNTVSCTGWMGRRLGQGVLGMVGTASRSITYRSLPANDPFGEKSSMEDPSEAGRFAGWKDVSQDHFAAAADSAEVRQAHFGPEWARFSTVGKMALHQASQDAHRPLPSAEEANEATVKAKRELLSHNYSSYEEYLSSSLPSLQSPEEPMSSGTDESNYDEVPALPSFLSSSPHGAKKAEAVPTDGGKNDTVPAAFTAAVYRRFPLFCFSIPNQDPAGWDTATIIEFLSHYCPLDEDGSSVMDDTMRNAFEMAAVSGDMLLRKVNPPRLFSVLRRWHITRIRVVKQLWAHLSTLSASHDTESKPAWNLDDEFVQSTVEAGKVALEKSVHGLTKTLVQETVLLCFPYGYGRF